MWLLLCTLIRNSKGGSMNRAYEVLFCLLLIVCSAVSQQHPTGSEDDNDGQPKKAHSAARVDLTGQTAAIPTTNLYAVPATGGGMYSVCYSAKVTTPASTSSLLG